MTPEQQIAAHIARHGVTRCPTVAAAETTATIDPADIAALAARKPVLMADGRPHGSPWMSRAKAAALRAKMRRAMR